MIRILAVFVFFVTFFRITVISSSAYLAMFIGVFGVVLLFSKRVRQVIVYSSGYVVVFMVALFSLFLLVLDTFSGGFVNNFSNSFFVRLVAFFVMSVLPAVVLYFTYLQGDERRLTSVVSLAFYVQAILWFVTYFSPDFKVAVYSFMGHSYSVNLRDYNMGARGFGMSNEINFTSPFLMVVLCFFVIKKNSLTFVTALTQLVNSNMVVLAAGLGLIFSRIGFLKRSLIVLSVFLMIFLFGDYIFVRLYDEISSGGGRTIMSLLENHVFFLNDGLFEHFFGAGEYVFQGGHPRNSDIGWVIMYNYGGVFFVTTFIVYLAASSIAAFGATPIGFAWFFIGILLNAKGLIFGPNSYFFITVLMSFFRNNYRFSNA